MVPRKSQPTITFDVRLTQAWLYIIIHYIYMCVLSSHLTDFGFVLLELVSKELCNTFYANTLTR